MRAQDEHPARIDGTAPEVIGTEREFMDALRTLRVRSGLSYRDVALRMSRVAPRHALAKSTLAALFAQDTLPRRPGQLTAIVDVLTAELPEPADASARYLEAWTRLMTARSAQPGTSIVPHQAPPPALATAAAASLPRRAVPLYALPAYQKTSCQDATRDEAKSDFEQAGGLLPLLFWGTVISIITWLPFMDGPVPFWAIWLGWCGPVLLCTAIAALFRQPRGSGSAELPAEYLRYEQRTTPRWPSPY
jgi:hypothetical protein